MEVQLLLGTHRLLEPVSKMTLNCGKQLKKKYASILEKGAHLLRGRAEGDGREILSVHKVFFARSSVS